MSPHLVIPAPILQFTDGNGTPLAGGKLYAFAANSTEAKTVYKDPDGTASFPHPMILNARGEVSDTPSGAGMAMYGSGSYKFVLASADGDAQSPVWTQDYVTIPTISAWAESLLAAGGAEAARDELDLGGAAVRDVYEGATYTGNAVAVDGNGRLPAVDGRALVLTGMEDENLPVSTLAVPRSYLAGLGLTWQATNQIEIAMGICRDSTDTANMKLEETLSKEIDSAWEAGDGVGGLDAGNVTGGSWYYVWLIQRSDTGVADALFSSSATAPTMPADYDLRRRIGAVRTDENGHILEFKQHGDLFLWNTAHLDVDPAGASNITTTDALYTLNYVPIGLGLEALITVHIHNGGAAPTAVIHPTSVETIGGGDIGDPENDMPNPEEPGANIYVPATGVAVSNERIWVDANAQFYAVSQDADRWLAVYTRGWVDRRGRDD